MSHRDQAAVAQRRASDPDVSAWVNANAGSGKTRVLVYRVIRLMLAGAPPSRILCLTFTKAAAAEMALRIFDELSAWIWHDDTTLAATLRGIGVQDVGPDLLQRARRLFAQAQETPGGLKIQTIHAFCERLLQLFPVEAGVVPNFSVLTDRDVAVLMAETRDATLLEALEHPETPLGRALDRLSQLVQADQLDALLKDVMSVRTGARDLLLDADKQEAARAYLRAVLNAPEGMTLQALREAAAIDRDMYERAATVFAASGPRDQHRGTSLRALLANPHCSLLDMGDEFLTEKGPRKYEQLPGKDAHTLHPWVRPFMIEEQQRYLAVAQRHSDFLRFEATDALLVFANHALQRYEAQKRARGHYDFDDLIARSRALLAERPDAAWVLYKLDGGIDHVLVDEAQDTSPEQWDIVSSLTGEFFAGAGRSPTTRTMFAVGDRKQSIFGFQGADPDVFLAKQAEFQRLASEAGQEFRNEKFNVSFRSASVVLAAVDAVFADGAPARAGLDGALKADLLHQSVRAEPGGLVELWDAIGPEEEPDDDPWTTPTDRPPSNAPSRRLAQRIATTIKSWIGRREIASLNRVVAPQDILILVRRRNVLFSQLISALRLAGVPVAGADRLKLGESLAVQDLLALGQVATLAADDYALACVLKSPVLAQPFSEDELFQLAHGRGPRTLWQALVDDPQPVSAAARSVLLPLVAASQALRPFEFFSTAVQASRARFLSRLGSEADDAIAAFLQETLNYELDHAPSLSGFLAWFLAGEVEIKREMDKPSGEVRIITVHGAKGLEAPIVILPDTAREPDTPRGPQVLKIQASKNAPAIPLWRIKADVDSQTVEDAGAAAKTLTRDEYHRLLYVALTRARDELYICAAHGKNGPGDGSWYELVRKSLEQKFAGALVAIEGGVRLGDAPVWREEAATSRLPAATLPAFLWQSVKPEAPQAAPHPVTRLAADTVSGRPETPGQSRGLAMHRLLQVLPETDEAARGALARQIALRAGFGEDLAQEALDLLATPALAELFRPDGLAEVMLTGQLEPEGLAVSGRIDRLIVSETTVTLADFKTDRQPPRYAADAPPAYLRQMGLYRRLMEQAYPGRAIRCLLLWTSTGDLMDLPDSLLDRAMQEMQPGRP